MSRYYVKTPGEDFVAPLRGYWKDIYRAKKAIEDFAKTSSEPWLQLVQLNEDGFEVVAEYKNHGAKCWVSPEVAAGFCILV